MKYLKFFESLFDEDFDLGENFLILLIDDDGIEYPKRGAFEEGFGIFDEDGVEYPAGVTIDGEVVASNVIGSSVLSLKGDKIEGLEDAIRPGFNYFEGFEDDINESYDFDKLSKDDLNVLNLKLVESLNNFKERILGLIEYDQSLNKIIFKNEFSNIDIESEVSSIKEEFGDDITRELNIEALFRKIYQIIVLKKRSTRRRIREEIKAYIDSLERRILRQKEDFGEDHFDEYDREYSILPRKRYEKEKYSLQVELMKLQEWVVKNKKRVAIVFEGRDAAGKGSTIKRFTEYLNPNHFRVVALGIPTEDEKKNWLQRYEKHLPKDGEIVFFDRSWYNRAVVEPAMGYCTEEEYKEFIDGVVPWEEKLIGNGLILIKFWFSITREKQLQRFKIRQDSPLKYWKFSPNDAKVIDKFEMIGSFKNEMFQKTSTDATPWVIINSNDKKVGRLNAIRYVIDKIDYESKDENQTNWYPEVVNILL